MLPLADTAWALERPAAPSLYSAECSVCGAAYELEPWLTTCPAHPETGILSLIPDVRAIGARIGPSAINGSRDRSMWRYLPLLALSDPGLHGTPIRTVGWTPLHRADRLAARLGLASLWVKDEGRNPTGSLKDRASAAVLVRARELGAATVVTASTGNAGAALAGLAAATGQRAVVMVPAATPAAKLAEIALFGARLVLVDGSYDDACDLSVEAARELGWLCRNTGYNPFTAEGKKTAAFEIAEQLARASGAVGFRAPDRVFVSVGDGNILSGLHRGFADLAALGWIDRMPRLMGVQAAGSTALYDAFCAGTTEIAPVAARSACSSLNVDSPRDGRRALAAVRATGGAFLEVGDEAIAAAVGALARHAAVLAEPAGAAALAGLAAAIEAGLVDPDEEVVVVNTAHGGKEAGARPAGNGRRAIAPTLKALVRHLEGL